MVRQQFRQVFRVCGRRLACEVFAEANGCRSFGEIQKPAKTPTPRSFGVVAGGQGFGHPQRILVVCVESLAVFAAWFQSLVLLGSWGGLQAAAGFSQRPRTRDNPHSA